MTALTPEQMRALADELDRCADNDRNPVRVPLAHESAAALRAAADQLEAVRELMDGMFDNGAVSVRAIRFALTRHGVNAPPRKSGHEGDAL